MEVDELMERRERIINQNDDLRKYIGKLKEDLKKVESEASILQRKIALVNSEIVDNQEEFEKLGRQLKAKP